LLGLFDPEHEGDVPPKHRFTFNGLRGVISQKMVLFTTTAVRASNPTYLFLNSLNYAASSVSAIWCPIRNDRMIMNGESGNTGLREEAKEVYFKYNRITYYKERAEGRPRKLMGTARLQVNSGTGDLLNMKHVFQPLQYNVRFLATLLPLR
jgi:hypothetical protein